jgi:acylphosphatase
MYKSSGTKMSYDDAIRTLIKRGSLDLEVIGNTKNANNEDVPAVANFDTAEQVARALNNKNNQKGDEPIFPYEENPQ